jgi:hypothetical protein
MLPQRGEAPTIIHDTLMTARRLGYPPFDAADLERRYPELASPLRDPAFVERVNATFSRPL